MLENLEIGFEEAFLMPWSLPRPGITVPFEEPASLP
jgi:hypothetical protein